MQPVERSASRTRKAWALGALVMACGPVWADGAAILRCRQQADPALRFACYEAIAVPQAAAAPAAQPVAAPVAAPMAAREQFGLEQKNAPVAIPSIESRINGAFYGWEPNERITLANGQVWQVTDDSRAAVNFKDPKVTVRRGALGAFYLEFEGTNRSPKVRRVQ